MFRLVLGLLFIALLIELFLLIKNEKWNISKIRKQITQDFFLNLLLYRELITRKKDRYKILRKIFFTISAVLFTILALTGFIPVLIFGTSMTGLWLLIHVSVAPLFVFSLTMFVLLQAYFQQFDHRDYEYLKSKTTISERDERIPREYVFQRKIYFWLFIILTLPAIFSIIFSMYKVFGTAGQFFLIDLHRYSVLLLLLNTCLYLITRYKTVSNTSN
jgi:cytochrome b subunit of formate dehydrogenase